MRTVKIVASSSALVLVAGALLIGGPVGANGKGSSALVARLKNAAGADVGTVKLRSHHGIVRVTARATGLTPGFHGFHVHTTGLCNPQAKDTTGATVPFFSAGGHYNPGTKTHGAHAGDMPPLLVMSNGRAELGFTTDRFDVRELTDADGSAIVVHAGPDNLAHVPAATATGSERYHSHVDNVFGPDTATRATGDAGARFACGVLRRG